MCGWGVVVVRVGGGVCEGRNLKAGQEGYDRQEEKGGGNRHRE